MPACPIRGLVVEHQGRLVFTRPIDGGLDEAPEAIGQTQAVRDDQVAQVGKLVAVARERLVGRRVAGAHQERRDRDARARTKVASAANPTMMTEPSGSVATFSWDPNRPELRSDRPTRRCVLELVRLPGGTNWRCHREDEPCDHHLSPCVGEMNAKADVEGAFTDFRRRSRPGQRRGGHTNLIRACRPTPTFWIVDVSPVTPSDAAHLDGPDRGGPDEQRIACSARPGRSCLGRRVLAAKIPELPGEGGVRSRRWSSRDATLLQIEAVDVRDAPVKPSRW